jgi:uncharacterized protein DUF5990
MQIRIEGIDLPGSSCGPSPDRPGGHHGIHVGVQRKSRPTELLGLTPGDAEAVSWTLECDVAPHGNGYDVKGPYISGTPESRWIYLNWVMVDDGSEATMFRRAKLLLSAVPDGVMRSALQQGVLVGQVHLTDPRGNPVCAAIRPPVIEWRAAGA